MTVERNWGSRLLGCGLRGGLPAVPAAVAESWSRDGGGNGGRRGGVGYLGLLGLGGLLLFAGCGQTEVADERITVPDVSLQALDDLPDGIEGAVVTIEGGAFSVEKLILQEDEPTVLTVVNQDDQAYRFQIVETLLKATEIPANASTDIAFTTPNANVYEGQLLGPERSEVIATMVVTVQSPTGTTSG